MKEFKLISFEDLSRIAVYLDRIDDLFPVKSVPELAPLRERAHVALGATLDSGNEGIVHAKLDAILDEMSRLNGRFEIAEQVAGPPIYQGIMRQGKVSVGDPVGPRFNRNDQLRDVARPPVIEQTLADLDFDAEGGEVL